MRLLHRVGDWDDEADALEREDGGSIVLFGQACDAFHRNQ